MGGKRSEAATECAKRCVLPAGMHMQEVCLASCLHTKEVCLACWSLYGVAAVRGLPALSCLFRERNDGVLQWVAACCSVLQCVAVCCSVLQCVAVCCSVLQCVTVRYSALQLVVVFYSVS